LERIEEVRELESLVLPNGKPAKSVRWNEVRRVLEPVLDDYSPNDGKEILLKKFAAKQRAERLASDAEFSAEDTLAGERAKRRRLESRDPGVGFSVGRIGALINNRGKPQRGATVRP
jgi:hypothetical protein